jgi:hypothetical protein
MPIGTAKRDIAAGEKLTIVARPDGRIECDAIDFSPGKVNRAPKPYTDAERYQWLLRVHRGTIASIAYSQSHDACHFEDAEQALDAAMRETEQ